MGLLNIAGLGNGLPVNAYAVLNLVEGRSYGASGLPEISGVLSSLSSLTAGAYSANHVYTPTDASWASQELISERQFHRRRARCGAGGLHRFAGPRGSAPGAARSSCDRHLAQGRAGHPGTDRARDDLVD